jgi:type IV pilus assembly protein PilP
MRIQFKQVGTMLILVLLVSCFLWNCSDQKEPSKAPVVSKKISAPSTPSPSIKSDDPQTDLSVNAAVSATATEKEEAVVAARIYDPKERMNPFIPLFRDEKNEAATDQSDKSKRKKRVPQTPLERISLNQLKLAAIIRTTSGNKALVEDNTGKGFIIKNGTYIGLNSGIVTQINASSVIIEEEIENLMGELILQNTEIKLQKPAGE